MRDTLVIHFTDEADDERITLVARAVSLMQGVSLVHRPKLHEVREGHSARGSVRVHAVECNVVVTLPDGASAVFLPSCDIAIEVARRLRSEPHRAGGENPRTEWTKCNHPSWATCAECTREECSRCSLSHNPAFPCPEWAETRSPKLHSEKG